MDGCETALQTERKGTDMEFTIGGIAGWIIVSLCFGKLLPVLSLPAIIAVAVGGTIGQVVGLALVAGRSPDQGQKQ